MKKDFAALTRDFWKLFDKGMEIVFATSTERGVAARTVAAAYVGGKVCFATFDKSAKCEQIRRNPNVALCLGAVQISGTAAVTGGGELPENKTIMDALRAVFPIIDEYASMPGMVIVSVTPEAGAFMPPGSKDMFALDFVKKQANKIEM